MRYFGCVGFRRSNATDPRALREFVGVDECGVSERVGGLRSRYFGVFYKTGQKRRHNQQGRARHGIQYVDVYLSKDEMQG